MGLILQGQNILFQCQRYNYGIDIMVVPSGRLSAATRRTAVPKSFPLFHVLDASRFKFDLYTTAHSGTSFLLFPGRCEMLSIPWDNQLFSIKCLKLFDFVCLVYTQHYFERKYPEVSFANSQVFKY